MTMSATKVEIDPATAAACLFHGFGERARMAIVQRLLEVPEERVVDLTARLGLAQSTVSRHLTCLVDCGVVTVSPRGRASLYALAHPEQTRALLRAAEELLEVTGHAVVQCARYGVKATRQA